jgi:hypothetical protein
MGWLDRFTPGQRQALVYGAPLAAGAALVSIVKGRAAKPPATAPSTPSTDAIGVGQLSEFESMVSDQLAALAQQVADQKPNPHPAPRPSPPPPRQPDHTQAVPTPAQPAVTAALAATVSAAAPPAPWPQAPGPAATEPQQWAQNAPPGWLDDINRPLWW